MRTDIVLVKLGAAFIVVTALGNFQHYLALIIGKPWWFPTAMIALAFAVILPFAIAVVFWKFPHTLVGSLYSEEVDKQRQDFSTDGLYQVGIALLGMYALVFGFIQLVNVEALRFGFERHVEQAGVNMPLFPEATAERIAGVVQVVIGVALIYGRRGISSFLRRVRTAGHS